MKRMFLMLPVLLGMMFLLTACPYESNVPISEPNEEIREDLLGSWVSVSEADYPKHEQSYYTIEPSGEHEYIITNIVPNQDSYTYHMHTTKVKNMLFLNIQEDDGPYMLHRIEFNSDGFVLFEVSDYIDEYFMSSKELYKFVKKNMNHSFFYTNSATVYVKYKK